MATYVKKLNNFVSSKSEKYLSSILDNLSSLLETIKIYTNSDNTSWDSSLDNDAIQAIADKRDDIQKTIKKWSSTIRILSNNEIKNTDSINKTLQFSVYLYVIGGKNLSAKAIQFFNISNYTDNSILVTSSYSNFQSSIYFEDDTGLELLLNDIDNFEKGIESLNCLIKSYI